MRMRAVEERLAAILETDWKTEATLVLAERQASGVGEVGVGIRRYSPASDR
jgi:hypothetical protein